jgi:Tol biopolymer transport system component
MPVLALLGLVLVACGDEPKATSPASTTVALTTSANATSTPVVLLPTSAQTALAANTAATTALSNTVAPVTATLPPATPQPLPMGLPGKISIVGNDGQLYLSRLDGKSPQILLGQAGVNPVQSGDGQIFAFPTWSKDGKKLAAISLNIKSGALVTSDVWVVKEDGTSAYKVRDSEPTGGIYLNFSPDGNVLSMLVGGNGTLELQVADTSTGSVAKPAAPRKLLEGQPVYSSWASDNATLLVHTADANNDTLNIIDAKNPVGKNQNIPFKPGSFRAPEWSSDGTRFAYVAAADSPGKPQALVISDKDGKELSRQVGNGEGMSFNWSPDGKQLAFMSQAPSGDFYDALYMADVTAGTKTKIDDGIVLAFFWSPDSRKIAYVTLNPTSNIFTWLVYDLASKKSTLLMEWGPSEATAQILSYADQYSQSDSIWSPDSRALVFGGYDKAAIMQPQPGEPQIYILQVEGTNSGQYYKAGVGELAFWSK